MKCLISVVVPVYNVEKYIDRCLNSIINQTYRKLEIIIVNDGSTDNSRKIIDKFSKMDSRIIVIDKNNGGLSEARNVGINAATGDYITFIDSDDFVSYDYIEYLYSLIEKYKVKVASSFYQIISSEEEIKTNEEYIDQKLTAREAVNKMLYRENIAHIACGKLYSLDLFRNKPTINFSKFFSRKEYYEFNPVENSMYKFPVGILNEDLALIYFLIIEAGSIAQGTKKTYYYFSNPDSISRSRVKKKDFSVFSLYEFVSSVILDYYPDLDDAVLEFRNTIYVKLYKRIMLNQRNDYKDEQKFIKEQLKKSMARTIKSKIRRVTKIRSIVGGLSDSLFIILCKVENIMGAKS